MSGFRLYNRYVLPHLINFAMSAEEVTRVRASHVTKAKGVVLEVGIGSGLNVPFYTDAVTHLFGIDPSHELLAMAQRTSASASFPVELIEQEAEHVPLPPASVDTVVVTWSLCSIVDPDAALSEMRRVLRSDGMFIFVEHGLAPDAGVRKWQNRLTPVWKLFAGGCHLNRPVADMIRRAGFSITELRTEYLPGARPMTFMYEGIAHANDSIRHGS